MDFKSNASCDGFPSSSSTSSKSFTTFICGKAKKEKPPLAEEEPVCPTATPTTTSTSSSMSIGYFDPECRLQGEARKPPNIAYETAIAKSIMQQYSTISGDNLFDHLSDIIKRVVDERPPNIIDFFEEFSRNVREQKFHLPERFPPEAIFEETRMYRVAKQQLISMKLPHNEETQDNLLDEDFIDEHQSVYADELKLDIVGNAHLFKTFNERVQQLQFYWNQCGFSISTDDIFQLACAMTRLQTHPSILQCRFWGVINGLKASYYVVEASLTLAEINSRMEQMKIEMDQKNVPVENVLHPMPPQPQPNIGNELIPGIDGWENWPIEELEKMQPPAPPVPQIKVVEVFDVPPEPIGTGLNRYSYFVVNTLSDEWIELPIVTPKQIIISRKIKKFMTGDLESDILSTPCFPGKEKHYLRAMISRITAGTYIAPRDYYRKMTKKEQRLYEGLGDDEMDEEEEEDLMGEDEEEITDNDVILLKNDTYEPLPLLTLSPTSNWLHVRPNILKQGRIIWFDEEKARKEREKELARLLKLQMAEEQEEEEEEEEAEEEELEGEGEEELDEFDRREIGPAILSPCNEDASTEDTVPWVARLTSSYTNKNERVLVMRSNVWPGAYSFTFDKICESIYMGWGHKYVARNMAFEHLPDVAEEFPHNPEDFIEANDPTVEEEEAYRLALLRRQQRHLMDGEHLGEFDDDYEDAATDGAD